MVDKRYEDDRGEFIFRYSKAHKKVVKIYVNKKPGFLNMSDEEAGRTAYAQIAKIAGPEYPDASYDIFTLKKYDLNDGYQASFVRKIDDYSDEEYGKIIKEILSSGKTDGIVYAGKFKGDPEVSFKFKDLDDAMELAEKWNQRSVWDNYNMVDIENPKHVNDGTNDYWDDE